jgi:hypothetical protein
MKEGAVSLLRKNSLLPPPLLSLCIGWVVLQIRHQEQMEGIRCTDPKASLFTSVEERRLLKSALKDS